VIVTHADRVASYRCRGEGQRVIRLKIERMRHAGRPSELIRYLGLEPN
jgi:hypothetical protein